MTINHAKPNRTWTVAKAKSWLSEILRLAEEEGLQRFGRTLELGDALIAGTAKTYDLAIATRNVTDFGDLDVDLVNPWESP